MITLRIIDQVNCQFEGLTKDELTHCQKTVSYPIPGAFMTAAVKSGFSDGRESLMSGDGFTYIYLIDHLLTVMEEELGIDIDGISLVIDSEPFELDVPPVDEDWLLDELGYKLRDYQIDTINSVIPSTKGLYDLATNAGKTAICLGISKLLDPFIKTVVIVPSEKLSRQTAKDYRKSSLNTLLLESKIKPKDREKKIQEARHIITTLKLFLNEYRHFHEKYAIILDEAHIFGDVTADVLRFEMAHCPIRLGFTGTIPKDRLKSQKLKATIGGDIINTVKTDELISRGFASTVDIQVYRTSHIEFEKMILEMRNDSDIEATDVYQMEESYLNSNKKRIHAIAEFIKSFDIKNTLILCHPPMGEALVEIFGGVFIRDEVCTDERDRLFEMFGSIDDHCQVASYGTSSTGISENRIFRIVLIDVGKNETRVKQSIGRGLRLDGEHNHIDIIDISADTWYSKNHRSERLKLYKSEKYQVTENDNFIMVA